MALSGDLSGDINRALHVAWDHRTGYVVPTIDDIKLLGGGVEFDATFLYSDLADSTKLAMADKRVAARVISAYLAYTSRLIRAHGGHIRSYDGDRVMGIFRAVGKNTQAAICALKIQWTFNNYLKPRFEAKYATLTNAGISLAQCTGIDTSKVLAVRVGIRNNNDLVWIGRAPNIAAKLSNARMDPYRTWITGDVFDDLADKAKFYQGSAMWEEFAWNNGPVSRVCRSHWTLGPDYYP